MNAEQKRRHDWLLERDALLRRRIESFAAGSVTMEHMADLLELTWRMLPDDLSEAFDSDCTPGGVYVDCEDGECSEELRSEAELASELGVSVWSALVRVRPEQMDPSSLSGAE